MSETPRYRCAAEKGFLPEGSVITFAKFDYREGMGSRVEQDDEFDFEGVPGAWMDPINEAARARVASLVEQRKRISMNAPVSAPRDPVKPPKMHPMRAVDSDVFNDVRLKRDEPETAAVSLSNRPAPRRRAARAT